MSKTTKKAAEVIYHFTCEFHLPSISKSGYLTLTNCNFCIGKPMPPILWLTTSPTPENNGLLFNSNIPDDLNKTHVRFTIRKKSYMQKWNEWHKNNGRDKVERETLITTAGAEETYKTWYISLIPINMGEVLLIENLKTGKVYYKK